jgi:hypothetical protein
MVPHPSMQVRKGGRKAKGHKEKRKKKEKAKAAPGGWWAPKSGDRITAGLHASTFAQDSYTAHAAAAEARALGAAAAAKPAGGRRCSLLGGGGGATKSARAGLLMNAVLTPRTKEARGKGVRAPGSGSAGASPSSSGRYASCVEASAAPAAPAAPAALAVGASGASPASASPPPLSRADSDGSGLEERLAVMEELWGSGLLEAGFAGRLNISTQLRSLPVLRQQPVSLVVQTKSTVAVCRLDLGQLPPIASGPGAPHCEMQFELPLVRHGLTVGCATGTLVVTPGWASALGLGGGREITRPPPVPSSPVRDGDSRRYSGFV